MVELFKRMTSVREEFATTSAQDKRESDIGDGRECGVASTVGDSGTRRKTERVHARAHREPAWWGSRRRTG